MSSLPRRATLTDVAHRARVSIKTASRVINGVESVAPELRDQVLSAAQQLGYRPHRGAATMRSGTSDMVGMVIRNMCNEFYSTMAAGAAEEAERHGCLLITVSSEGSSTREEKLVEAVFAQRPRGLLITPTPTTAALVRAEVAMGTPVVAVDEPLTGVEVDTVAFDNLDASRDAVSAAVELGRRRFAMLSDTPQIRTMVPRLEGADTALRAAGLTTESSWRVGGLHTVSEARAATAGLLSTDDPPDAIFCANNVSALGAAAEIHVRGLDVALVAFDDFPLSHTQNYPVLIIEHDDREMGRTAARLLFERLADPQRPIQQVVIPTTLRIH